jgi:glutathione peroxidase
MTALTDFTVRTLDGNEKTLADYKDQVVLVVNTASKCGFTPQYKGLQELQEQYADRGLSVIGFPCNQFGHQEPGDSDEIGEFCERNYGVTFQMMEKIDVNGSDAHPLYQWLRSQKGGLMGDKIKWNFTKFLIGKDGQVIERYAPTTKPEKLKDDIEKALAG